MLYTTLKEGTTHVPYWDQNVVFGETLCTWFIKQPPRTPWQLHSYALKTTQNTLAHT